MSTAQSEALADAGPTATQMPTALIRSEWPLNDGLRPGDERFDAVLASIRAVGIRHPLSIKLDWQVIHGAHRLAAARLLKLPTVPVVVWTGAEFVPAEPSDCQSNDCDHPAVLAALPNREDAPSREGLDLDRLLDFVAEQPSPGDWACAECRPDSHMLVAGFRCVVHEARAAVATPPGDPARPLAAGGGPGR